MGASQTDIHTRPPDRKEVLPASWNQRWILGSLLAGITIIAYLPALQAGFIWNDDTFLLNNPLIRRPDGLYWFWFSSAAPDYFPATSTMLWLEWRLWGTSPFGYHLVNVLLHAGSAILLWRVLARLNLPAAWLAAAVFAVHPVNVESVAWITERKNTLAMAFYATALLLYLRFDETNDRKWYQLAAAAFALSLLSKPAAVMLPIVLLGIVWWKRGRVERKDVLDTAPFFMLAVLLGLLTAWFQSHRAIGPEIVRDDGFWSRLAGAGWAVWFYSYKALIPINLIFVYPRWQIDATRVLSYAPVVLLAGVIIAAWHFRRSWGRAVLFGLGYFILMLLPVLGFLNIYFMRYSLVADHWQYFAILAPIALVSASLAGVLDSRRYTARSLGPILGSALVLLLGILTWQQCGTYADIETLWRRTLARNPGSYLAHTSLGTALLRRNQPEEAIIHFRKALEIRPDYEVAHYDLGEALLREGRVEEAVLQFRTTLDLDQNYVGAHNNLANILAQQGKPREAITHYETILKLRPQNPDAANNLAWLLATCSDPSCRDGATALKLAQRAERLSGGKDPVYTATLAAAFAELSQFTDALATAQRALQVACLHGDTALAARLARQIESYQARSPIREGSNTNALSHP